MKKLKIFLGSIVIIFIVTSLFIPFKTAVVFYHENTDDIVAFLPIERGETFEIIFTHSIHLSDVEEKYIVTDDLEIEQYEIVFEEFGVGMPSNAEGDQIFEVKDGRYHISNLQNYFPSMNIRNGKTVSEHRLLWERENGDGMSMVWFNDYFEPGAWFKVQVDKLSLLQYMRGVRIDERR